MRRDGNARIFHYDSPIGGFGLPRAITLYRIFIGRVNNPREEGERARGFALGKNSRDDRAISRLREAARATLLSSNCPLQSRAATRSCRATRMNGDNDGHLSLLPPNIRPNKLRSSRTGDSVFLGFVLSRDGGHREVCRAVTLLADVQLKSINCK